QAGDGEDVPQRADHLARGVAFRDVTRPALPQRGGGVVRTRCSHQYDRERGRRLVDRLYQGQAVDVRRVEIDQDGIGDVATQALQRALAAPNVRDLAAGGRRQLAQVLATRITVTDEKNAIHKRLVKCHMAAWIAGRRAGSFSCWRRISRVTGATSPSPLST